MLNVLKYERQSADGEARLYKLTNPILQYEKLYPSVFFNIETKEDVQAIKTYYFNNYPSERIGGFVIPFDKLREYASNIYEIVPNAQVICEVSNERFFYGRLKEKSTSFYYGYNAIPPEIRATIKKLAETPSFTEKTNMYRNLWSNIVSNDSHLFKMTEAYIKPQMTFGVTVLESIGTLLFNTEDINTNTICYDYSKKLYHTGNRDIENTGKIICYPAHIYQSFLKKRSNIDELINSINDSDPKGIILKLVDIDDMREKPALIGNYNYLVKNVKELSETLEIPSFYLSTHTEGLISLTRGIDAFSQSFNRPHNLPRDIRLPKEKIQELWTDNPKLTSGLIYNYRTKEMMNRVDFEKMMENNNNLVNAPVGDLARYGIDEIKNMTPSRFRIYAKMFLMATKNLEVQEIHDAIENRTTLTMRSKFKSWLKDLSLFPT